jgi:cell division protein ZapE
VTPTEHYQQALKNGFSHDDYQHLAVEYTQRLYDALTVMNVKPGLIDRLLGRKKAPRGLYLWGGTGRGKTWLIDSFYSCLPFAEKHRTHFHAFMRDIHARLQQLPKTPDPLKIIATDLAKKIRLLCLDEFHVHDIGDAMIMANLLEAIFAQGITLVATSNIAINDLYRNGLQRERFLPTIELLQKSCDELDLGDDIDYRFSQLEKRGTYFIGNHVDGSYFLSDHLTSIIPCPAKQHRQISINDRPINYIALADDIIWFDFDQICNTPRSDSDYISLAETFHTIMISNVRPMHEEHDNIAKRFIHLIDAIYDHQTKCIIAASHEPQNLYHGRALTMAFERTISRLIEMDSEHYLSLPHRISVLE